MTEKKPNKSAYQIESPIYQDGYWTASITLGQKHKTFYGETQEEVQRQVLDYLDQLLREIREARESIHKALEDPLEQ
jgi:hypothetical protein